MKKSLFLIIIALFLCSLTCCNSDSNQNEQSVSDSYIFRTADGDSISWNSFGMPYKINLRTTVMTPACSDPLCLHEDDT